LETRCGIDESQGLDDASRATSIRSPRAGRDGGTTKLVTYPGQRHAPSTWRKSTADDAIGRAVSFFKDELVRP
jgi:hypothetical protein